MDQSLLSEWKNAVGNSFVPFIGKENHFTVGFSLLVAGIILSGLFGLNRSALNIPLICIPASLAISFGSIYMMCAVGVYV